MAQFFGEERSEFYAPFAEGFVTDLDAALVEQFLNVPVAQRKAMIEPDGVLDGDHGETVAVWFGVGHGASAYPNPIKATQPFRILKETYRHRRRRFRLRVNLIAALCNRIPSKPDFRKRSSGCP